MWGTGYCWAVHRTRNEKSLPKCQLSWTCFLVASSECLLLSITLWHVGQLRTRLAETFQVGIGQILSEAKYPVAVAREQKSDGQAGVGWFVLCVVFNELFGRALGLSCWSVLFTCSLSKNIMLELKTIIWNCFLTNTWVMKMCVNQASNACIPEKVLNQFVRNWKQNGLTFD